MGFFGFFRWFPNKVFKEFLGVLFRVAEIVGLSIGGLGLLLCVV